jgi:hypothetical protein
MYVIREIMNCKPGQVAALVTKFRTLGTVIERVGYKPFRLMTDVAGEPFWSVVAEMEVETIDDFVRMEAKVMAEKDAQQAMSGYHDLVVKGRREIYKLES